MKFTSILLSALTFVVLLGCNNTAEGMKEDATINKEKASEQSTDASQTAREVGSNVGAATMMTPKIKAALTDNDQLKDGRNTIDVDSTSELVTLNGWVTSEALKSLAEEITMRIVKENNGTQRIENKLEVRP